MKSKPLPSLDYLNQCFIPNFSDGYLIWNYRPRSHFNSDRVWKIFNTRFNAKIAGSLSKDGYFKVTICGKDYKLSRLIWKMYNKKDLDPNKQIDHKDRNPINNSIYNLREISKQENDWNRSSAKNSTSKHVGVFWKKERNKWESRIAVNKNQFYIGRYQSQQDAKNAYLIAKKYLHCKNPMDISTRQSKKELRNLVNAQLTIQ